MNENLEKAKNSKTFCIYPWIHQYVGPPGDVKPCCAFKHDLEIGSLKKNTLKEIWNNDATKQMRLDMLNGKHVHGCEYCYDREAISGGDSMRVGLNIRYMSEENPTMNMEHVVAATNPDGSLDEHKLYFIDARWNNLCNLKCRMCGPHYSSALATEFKTLWPIRPPGGDDYEILTYSGQTEDQLLTEILPHLNDIKSIYFAGGEPMMQKEHYMVLEELIRLGHTGTKEKPLFMYYNTNFSRLTLGKWDVVELWSHFKRVESDPADPNNAHRGIVVHASLDGSYERAEYWRKGTIWKDVVENRKRLLGLDNVTFSITSTMNWVNALNIIDFHREWVELGYIDKSHFTVNLLDGPEIYSLKTIPKFKKRQIEKAILDHIEWFKTVTPHANDWKTWYNAINFMNSVETDDTWPLAQRFKGQTDIFDNIRNENFFEVFPEHLDMKQFFQ